MSVLTCSWRQVDFIVAGAEFAVLFLLSFSLTYRLKVK